jgi:hypothetical protein
MPMEAFGDVDYSEQKLVPYGTSQLLKDLPLAPTSRVGQVAGEIGSFAPMSPAEALQAARVARKAAMAGGATLKQAGRIAGEELNAAMLGERRGTLIGAVTPQPSFIFIGENSKSWNKGAEELALKMEKAGNTPEDIWTATGTFRGPEGKLRQEISDKGAKITDDVFEGIKANQEFKGSASQALTHPELYAAYPNVAKIESGLFANATPEGSYHAPTDTILAGGPSTGAQRSAMLHELQHAIQQREGFIGGASPSGPYPAGVRDQIIKDQFDQLKALNKYDPSNPYSSPNVASDEELLKRAIRNTDEIGGVGRMDAYRRSAGEAEARAVQKRMNMTDEERRAVFPYESYDVKPNNLIIKNAGDVAQSTNGLRESRKNAPTELPQENALKLAQQRAALPVNEGGLGLKPNNTAAEREAAMFPIKAYRGVTGDVGADVVPSDFFGTNYFGKGINITTSAKDASKYASTDVGINHDLVGKAEVMSQKLGISYPEAKVELTKGGGAVMPISANIENPLVVGMQKIQAPDSMIRYALAESGYSGDVDKLISKFKQANTGIEQFELMRANQATPFYRNLSSLMNKDGLMIDPSLSPKSEGGMHYLATNPDQVRSRFAAFDPWRRTAAVAATMGVAAPDLLAKDKNQLRKGR